MLASKFVLEKTGLGVDALDHFIYRGLMGFFLFAGGWDVGNALLEIFQPSREEVEELGEEWERLLLDYNYSSGKEMTEFMLECFGPKEITTVEALSSAIVVLKDLDLELNSENLFNIFVFDGGFKNE